MRPDISMEQVGYALHSIATFGGGVQEADLIEYLLGEEALPFAVAIRRGMATKSMADELEAMLFRMTQEGNS